jgi:hypothetical protein
MLLNEKINTSPIAEGINFGENLGSKKVLQPLIW